MTEAYIVAAARTAGGRRGGQLKGWHPADLGALVLNALVDRSGVDPAATEDVIMGCVSQVGEQSNSIGRNAVLASRLPESVPATTIDRQCGSSQQALYFAAQAVQSGAMDIVIAAGVESMSRVPMGLYSALPAQHGFANSKSPGMAARDPGIVFSQFSRAEQLAEKHRLTRDDLDRFALHSHRSAVRATDEGAFDQEIVPVEIIDAEGRAQTHLQDEGIRREATLASIGSVRLISEGSRISAASASQICGGAAGLLVVNARGLGVQPLVRVHQTMCEDGGLANVTIVEAPT